MQDIVVQFGEILKGSVYGRLSGSAVLVEAFARSFDLFITLGHSLRVLQFIGLQRDDGPESGESCARRGRVRHRHIADQLRRKEIIPRSRRFQTEFFKQFDVGTET